MGWSGRVPAPPVSEPCEGRHSQGARYVSATQHDDRRDWCRYRQELVPHRRSRSARRHRAAAEMVTRPGGITVCQHAALPDRDGGLRRGTSSQSQAQGSWSRCPADAGLVGAVGVGGVFWAWPALQRVADGNRGVILAVLQGDRLVGVYSTESEARRAMAKGDVLVGIERNFLSLSPEQQNATIQKIAASERKANADAPPPPSSAAQCPWEKPRWNAMNRV